jgi:hypothetical protein
MGDYQLTTKVQSPKTTVDGSGVLARYLTEGRCIPLSLLARVSTPANRCSYQVSIDATPWDLCAFEILGAQESPETPAGKIPQELVGKC